MFGPLELTAVAIAIANIRPFIWLAGQEEIVSEENGSHRAVYAPCRAEPDRPRWPSERGEVNRNIFA